MARQGWDNLMRRVRNVTVSDERLLRMAVSLSRESRPQYNWTKIGEGYNVRLARDLLSKVEGPKVLDPFAGSGTTLVAASLLGKNGVGIELMPMCQAKFEWLRSWPSLDLEQLARQADLMRSMGIFNDVPPEDIPENAGLFGLDMEDMLGAMSLRSFFEAVPSMPERSLLQAATLMALKERTRTLSDTVRSDRDGKLMVKSVKVPRPPNLESAFAIQLTKMIVDLVDLEDNDGWDDLEGQELLAGSTNDVLPKLPDGEFDAVLTSPPYFNGFDYFEEYALDHWFLGLEDDLEHVQERFIPTGIEGAPFDGSRSFKVEFERARSRWSEEGLDLDAMLPEDRTLPHERDAFGKYLLEMSITLKQLARTTADKGTVTFVLDDAYVGDVDVPMDAVLMAIAKEHGLDLVKVHRYGGENEAGTSRLRLERQRTAIIRWKNG